MKAARCKQVVSVKARDIASVEMEVTPNNGNDAYRRFTEDEYANVAAPVNESRGSYVAEPEDLAGGAIMLYITTTDGAKHTVINVGNAYLKIDGDAYDAEYDWLSSWQGSVK